MGERGVAVKTRKGWTRVDVEWRCAHLRIVGHRAYFGGTFVGDAGTRRKVATQELE